MECKDCIPSVLNVPFQMASRVISLFWAEAKTVTKKQTNKELFKYFIKRFIFDKMLSRILKIMQKH